MVPQRAQGQPGLDHRIEPAVQPSGHLPGDSGVALLHLVGLDEGDAACRGGGESGEGLHDGTLGLGAGEGERAVGAEPETRDQRADLLPAPAGPERDVELLPVAPPAHPDQPEVAHRGAHRRRAGLQVRDLPTGAHELQRVPGAQDAPAGDDGPAVGRHGDGAARASSSTRGANGLGRLPGPGVAEDGAAGDEDVRACSRRHRRRVDVDAPVDLDVDRQGAGVDGAAHLLHLAHDVRHEALAAETGEHGHAQDEVDAVEVRPNRIDGRVGVEGDTGPQAEASHLGDELRGAADLDVDGAAVGARVGEGLEIAPGLRHHEVAVEEERRVTPQRGHDRWTDGEVGHEVPVHHVDVEPVGGRGHLADLLGQRSEIRRQDRGGDAHEPGRARIPCFVRTRRLGHRPAPLLAPVRVLLVLGSAVGARHAQRNRAQHRMRRNP